jgi:hypothetical protein
MPQIILVCEATNALFLQIGHSNLLLSEPFSVQVETEVPPFFVFQEVVFMLLLFPSVEQYELPQCSLAFDGLPYHDDASCYVSTEFSLLIKNLPTHVAQEHWEECIKLL